MRRAATAAAVAAFALLVGACGSGGEAPATSNATTATVPAATGATVPDATGGDVETTAAGDPGGDGRQRSGNGREGSGNDGSPHRGDGSAAADEAVPTGGGGLDPSGSAAEAESVSEGGRGPGGRSEAEQQAGG